MKLWISIYCPPCQGNKHAQLAALLAPYSPDITLLDAYGLAVQVAESLALIKGPLTLSGRIKHGLQQAFPTAGMAMAPTAWGAYLLARQAAHTGRTTRVIQHASMVRHLNQLPIQVLPAAQPYLSWFSELGCHTLADIRQLPRASLLVRSSTRLGDELDYAYGDRQPVFTWHQFDETFSVTKTLDYHSQNALVIEPVLKNIITQLCYWLQARQRAVSQLYFLLHYEKTRGSSASKPLLLQLSTPAWEVSDFLEVLKEKLAIVALDAPIVTVELRPVVGQQKPFRHHQLFPDSQHTQQQQRKLIDLLKARLGKEHILTPTPQASYLPDHANQWSSQTTHPLTPQTIPANQPFWLLHPPLQLACSAQDIPYYQGQRLHLLQGPERIESGWWTSSAHQRRDYFIAGDAQQRQYWIYRERKPGQANWFLHGIFA